MRVRPVLVVDDDRDGRSMLSALLVADGYSVVCASNGSEAIGFLRLHRPFVILLDMQMPVMDGTTLCARQRTLEADLRIIPVILVSGEPGLESLAAHLRYLP